MRADYSSLGWDIFGEYKWLMNKMENFDAILVLMERIYFPERGAYMSL